MMSEQAFNPREHLIQIKSGQRTGDYLPVQWRLVWFRERFPNGSIETELLHLDVDREMEEEVTVWGEDRKPKKVMKKAKGFAVFRATVKDGLGGIATGTGSEAAVSFNDYIEKSETKAVGRALAAMGFGTQFAGEEFNEGQRIVDSPVALRSSDLDKVKAAWATAYHIAENQIEERWPKYLVHLIGSVISDPDLRSEHLAKVNGDIEQQRKKSVKAS